MAFERIFIPGPAGKLEGLLESDPKAKPALAALACHPHPLFQGTMHNKVVFSAAKAAARAGLPVLRFNYRGVGLSAGEYGGGAGERDDVRAALDFLQGRFPRASLCMIGFSFGAWVGLDVGAQDSRVIALVGLGLPTSAHDLDFLLDVRKPKLVVQGTEDSFGPKLQVDSLFRALLEPKRIHWVEGADHFFTGHLDEMEWAVEAFLRGVITDVAAQTQFK